MEHNIFDSSPAHELVEELCHMANAYVAKKIVATLPEKAFLRKQAPPNPRRLQTLAERMTAIGYDLDISNSESLQCCLFNIKDADVRRGLETLLVKAMQRAKYVVAGKVPPSAYPHYALNLPVYTHFTNPLRRYADIIVHRQLEAVLSGNATDFAEDVDTLTKAAEMCNTKKDSAHSAQEQSVHIESCRRMDKIRQELGTDLISEGIVLCVYESAFDVLIPEYGFEKRVHCDQLPLKKAEFDKNKRLLELYWEKGVPSSAFVPEDERQKPNYSRNGTGKQRQKENEVANRQYMDTATISTDDADALFEDDEDAASELADMTSGVSLTQSGSSDRATQNTPPSPKRGGSFVEQGPYGRKSDRQAGDIPENNLSNKERFLSLFKLREQGNDHIQEVKEMIRVPVILKTDLTKSPPYVVILYLNLFWHFW